MDLTEIVNKFNEAGRFTPIPAVSQEELEKQEKHFGMEFPQDYKKVQTMGSFYKANIHFLAPERLRQNPEMVVFASWNDALFAFHTMERIADESPVYMIVGEFVEKKYDSFRQWFEMVLETATQPFASE